MKNLIIYSIILLSLSTSGFSQTAADRLYKDAIQFENTFKLFVQKPLVKAGILALQDEVGEDNLKIQLISHTPSAQN